MDADRRYLSRLDVAVLFEVSPHTVYRWTREGRLPYVLTPGGRRRYPREEIQRLATTWLRVHAASDRAARKAS
jgi:excisionase family DNA binding protein